jgi:hypothetical protein
VDNYDGCLKTANIPELAQVLCLCEGKRVTCAQNTASLQTCEADKYVLFVSVKVLMKAEDCKYFSNEALSRQVRLDLLLLLTDCRIREKKQALFWEATRIFHFEG